jgi:hypothetical protein
LDENEIGDLIVHAIPVEYGKHPSDSTLSVLFIKNLHTHKTYFVAFDHPDSRPDTLVVTKFQEHFGKMNNRKWALDKKEFIQLFSSKNVYDANYCGFLRRNEILDVGTFDTPSHELVRRHANTNGKVNKAIPLLKHKEAFEDMCVSVIEMINNFSIDRPFEIINNITIETLSSIESNGIHVDPAVFTNHFDTVPNKDNLVFSQYNIYTSTGRPSNRFGGVNYAALNNTDGSRKSFTSRYGEDGRMVMIDYTAFHPRIICSLTNYKLPITVDIYEYLAKLYFGKPFVDESDIKNAKVLTFRQLFGGVEDKYAHIKYLANLKRFIDEQWEFFRVNGYVVTPFFKRKITSNHIQDPNPAKLFNYILQATEGEVAIPQIAKVLQYLEKKKSKAVLYTYDSVLYDFYKYDGVETLHEIISIMSCNGALPMKTYIGNSYQNMSLASF